MENSLIVLLEANSRVIVPELGAFILRQKDPRELAFNDLLAFNDGMLSDHLEKTEGLSSEESGKRIREFVKDTKNNLSNGKDVKLEGLGILSMDASGKILFSEKPFAKEVKSKVSETKKTESVKPKEEKDNATVKKEPEPLIKPVKKSEYINVDTPLKESDDGEPFILDDQTTKVDVDASNDAPLESDKEEPPFTIEKDKDPEIEPDQEPVKSEEPTPPVETSHIDEEPEPVKSEEPTPPVETSHIDEEPEPVKLEEPKPFVQPAASHESIPSYVYRTEKKRVWPWIVGAISIVVILLVAAWFFFPEKANTILNRQAATENEMPTQDVQEMQAPVEEEKAVESVITETVPVEPEPEAPAVQAPSGKQYYVVAGCFEKIENAESYVTKLKGEGYDSRIFGMRKNLHAVCFNSHPDKSEALSELNRIRLQFDPSAWLLYY